MAYQLLVLVNLSGGSPRAALITVPINVLVLWVLVTRREHFLRGF